MLQLGLLLMQNKLDVFKSSALQTLAYPKCDQVPDPKGREQCWK